MELEDHAIGILVNLENLALESNLAQLSTDSQRTVKLFLAALSKLKTLRLVLDIDVEIAVLDYVLESFWPLFDKMTVGIRSEKTIEFHAVPRVIPSPNERRVSCDLQFQILDSSEGDERRLPILRRWIKKHDFVILD